MYLTRQPAQMIGRAKMPAVDALPAYHNACGFGLERDEEGRMIVWWPDVQCREWKETEECAKCGAPLNRLD